MSMDQMATRACLIVEPLMIDLTAAPATQNPSNPMMVCTTRMAVVTAATDGGLLSPLTTVIPGQLAAVRLAQLNGSDLDRPHGLSKITLTR